MTDLVPRYLAKLAGCATPNAVNQLHIALDTYITPADVEAILRHAAKAALPPASLEWLARLQAMASQSRLPLQPYVREAVGDSASLYTHPDLPPAGRTLVVAFAGDAHRLMMPTPVFLQHCRARDMDLMLIQDQTRSYFLRGGGGLADDFPGLVARIGADVGRRGYRRVVAFGVSGGGLPAVCMAVALGLDRAVSVGGSSPDIEDPRLALRGLSFAIFSEMLARRPVPMPEIVLVHAAGFPRDAEKAAALAALVPARRHPVAGTGRHNVLNERLVQGRLRPLLDALLLDGTALDH
ncbi:hypothetical protein [Stella sp.]|uniref:hypothetical protein n=1 Tax=Stella sp. TaxID=2912054 RepID=UPI0035B2C5D6